MEMASYCLWEYSCEMTNERRPLESWEKDECAALKACIADFNSRRPKEKRLTQEDIALSLGMSQGTLGSHLNGHRAISQKLAVGMANLLGIPVERFSQRLAGELSSLASAARLSNSSSKNDDGPSEGEKHRYEQTHLRGTSDAAGSVDREILTALALIVTVAANGKLPAAHAQTILKIRNDLVHASHRHESRLPGNLEGIASAAFSVAESGGNPDDLISMLEHGLNKESLKDKGDTNVRHTKPNTKRN